MKFQRGSGILLHITSLPSRFGIGDLGPKAFEFVDFLERSGQLYWQILPLSQTGYGDSPYSSFSAFAGNINLISLEKLVEDNLLQEKDLDGPPSFDPDCTEYGKAIEYKTPLLWKAFDNFRSAAVPETVASFHYFCDKNAFWLEDYSLYRAVKLRKFNGSWNEWDESLKLRRPEALDAARKELDEECFAQKFYQFIFFKQWRAVKTYANDRQVKIIGDLPIYVAFDSCDVWCNQERFKLNPDGTPKFSAGVPPDAFSSTGQLWGTPVYDWEQMRNEGFGWWIERVRANLRMFDIVRIDHFIGFIRAWEVPGEDDTAVNGKWIDVPGQDLFTTLQYALGELPLIAEDLGEVTPEVERLRDSFQLPGMRILQFAFGGDAGNIHLPHNFIQNTIAYTGTHDNDTVVGWYKERKKANRKHKDHTLAHCNAYLRTNGKEIHWDFIRETLASVSDIAIIPMQDILGLDNGARMNLPASADGNWAWRVRDDGISDELGSRLRKMCEFYGRKF